MHNLLSTLAVPLNNAGLGGRAGGSGAGAEEGAQAPNADAEAASKQVTPSVL